MRFYLGVHRAKWLEEIDVPLFISRRRLAGRRRLPRAIGPWALDSGGYTELSLHGRWTVPAEEYVEDVRRFQREIGNLEWAAIQDHMCEPWILKKTGSTVRQHQERTVASYLDLRFRGPDIPWVPVVQGWCLGDYLDHVEMYERAGVDLRALPLVGVGSVCRRQATVRAGTILAALSEEGLKLHAFGFKTDGLTSIFGQYLTSADSLAWSFNARKNRPLPECRHPGRCSNCLRWALEWRDNLLTKLARQAEPAQETTTAKDTAA